MMEIRAKVAVIFSWISSFSTYLPVSSYQCFSSPVVGALETLDLNSAGQQELCDRTVEVRAGATGYALRRFWPCNSVHSKRSNQIINQRPDGGGGVKTVPSTFRPIPIKLPAITTHKKCAVIAT